MYRKVRYSELNSRQKENHNFHKIAARLAENGFNCIRLTDDWEGADVIAVHIDGESYLKIQIKGRCTIDRKYIGKGIHVAFIHKGDVYLYDHDGLVRYIQKSRANIVAGTGFADKGIYHWLNPPKWALEFLDENRVVE